ncbi:MAG: type II toxin-antitoxin system RelE/ParE family toxin [Merismopedia sp. SIO2A8]|nr:type II toxin-antitoxin system RelE/ParE family toxin [Merismopedia sp. SIO2A8]
MIILALFGTSFTATTTNCQWVEIHHYLCNATGSFYRIRIGDYRIGIIAKGDLVSFIRVLHRREMYRNFP